MMKTKELYRKDSHAWCIEQVKLLKNKEIENLDLENLAEEIEAVGSWHRQKLTSSLRIIFIHLLKWIYQPDRRSQSWINSIERERDNAEILIKKNPSLRKYIEECVEDAYALARKEASRETGISLKSLPMQKICSSEESLKEGWMPHLEGRK